MSNNKQQTAVEQIKQFLYSEICERRDYSASRMCEEVLKFIDQTENGDNNKQNDMKNFETLEAGKTYRTRGGDLVKIIRNDGDDMYPFDGDNDLCYTSKGFYWDNEQEYEDDLIELIEDKNQTDMKNFETLEVGKTYKNRQNKLDMNMFAFVAWLGRNQHVHSEDGLTINDGYEWYNYMWNMWLKNSDIGRKISNGEITTMGGNNIPDNMTGENNNTSTTGNLSGNIWGGDRTSTTGNINTWTGNRTEYDNRIIAEKQIWDKTVNWDIRNKYTRVNDEEQAPYNVKTNVVTSGKTDDGTLAVIEITVKVRSN